MNEDVFLLINEARERNATTLNLSDQGLTEIPSEIANLTQLTGLYLHNNQITEIKGLNKLENLSTLFLQKNQITEIKGLDKLKNLSLLNLRINSIVEIKGLDKLVNLSELDLENNQIVEIKGLDKLVNLSQLDLRSNQITEIKSLDKLVNLSQLYLQSNLITEIKGLDKLVNLSQLYLKSNQITEIKGLDKLVNLSQLDLHSNLITEIKGLDKLVNLSQLYLKSNPITEIKGLDKLVNLSELDLQSNQITEIKGLDKLVKLSLLYLHSNLITEIKGLDKLVNLSQLYLHSNQITEIKGLDKLVKLSKLYLYNNQIVEIKGLDKLVNLSEFDLENNQITEIKGLDKLVNLSLLYLQSNLITEIKGLDKLVNLSQLYLHSNQINIIPFKLLDLDIPILWEAYSPSASNKKGFFVKDNPFTAPPPEVIKQGNEAIRKYLEELQKERVYPLTEAKLLIIGAGGVGKTSLMIKLKDPNAELPTVDKTTVGITVTQEPKTYTIEEVDYTLNIWDFGGQDIYHPTHQFFLTKNSIYVLMEDGREQKTDFHYWLQVQELLAADSPLYIIQNIKNDSRYEIPIKTLKSTFGNIKDCFDLDLAAVEEGHKEYDNIVIHLQAALQTLPHISEQWPETRFKIRDALLKLKGRHYISFQEYCDICNDHKYTDPDSQKQLLQQLHFLGSVLHFEDGPLEDIVITNPQWATDAVYAILDHTKKHYEKQGHFNYSDLKEVWKEEKYKNAYSELLTLMTKFELSFQLPEESNTYIAPLLLPNDKPDYEWEYIGSLRMKYKYDFMPKGILGRLIVRLHKKIKENLFWKNGVVLGLGDTQAEIIEDYAIHSINISVRGNSAKELIYMITTEIDDINEKYHFSDRIEAKKLVPCNCHKCSRNTPPHFYKYKVLLKRIYELKKKTIECQLSAEDVNVNDLLNAIEPRKIMEGSTAKIFISYSHADIDYREEIEKRLKPYLRSKKIEGVWVDHQIGVGEKWDDAIATNLQSANIILLLISADFWASDYIEEKELTVAKARSEAGECIVVPIIIRENDYWSESEWSSIQATPTDPDTARLVPVAEWPSQDRAWTAVMRAIKKLF